MKQDWKPDLVNAEQSRHRQRRDSLQPNCGFTDGCQVCSGKNNYYYDEVLRKIKINNSFFCNRKEIFVIIDCNFSDTKQR